jgi:hypothetical protein
MVSFAVTESGTALESVNWTVNVEVPAEVGVPEIVPVVGLSVSPAGREPLAIENAKGAVPPAADIVPP